MDPDLKQLAALIGKLTITKACELDITGEELGALRNVKMKLDGEYEEYVVNTEKKMSGDSLKMDAEDVHAVFGFLCAGKRIQAIKCIRFNTGLSLQQAKPIVDEAGEMMKSGNYGQKKVIEYISKMCNRTGAQDDS